ncbi:MAG: polysaccharide deacetylase family protein [Lachnospiraceae bacterium]|nr:polysaccharide deacetylase family protein [Lachnospiraceae bacterium]
MKSKIYVLVFSVAVALLIGGAAVFGIFQAKKPVDKDKTTETKGSENTTKDEDASKENQDTENGESSSGEENTTAEPETTTNFAGQNFQNSAIDPNKPMVALTFDDGPSRQNTNRILDALKQYNAHATFFMVGYNIDGNEDILRRVTEEGSEVANHSATHSKLTALDAAGIASEVDAIADKIKSITGQGSVLIRPPYGAVDENVMAAIKDPVILWSIDTEDWKTRNAQSTIQNIQSSVYDGAIILMHDLYGETADAAVQIIEWLNSQGYQMVTVSEMGYFRRGGLQPGVKYGSMKPN